MSRFKRQTSPLCGCGCGELVRWNKGKKRWNKYIKGHHVRTNNPMKKSEIKAKMTGENNPMKRPEARKKAAKRMKELGEDHPMKKLEARKAKSESMKAMGQNHPMRKPEIAIKVTGENHGMYGKKHTPEALEKMSGENNPMKRPEVVAKITGENNPSWKGGIAADPYCDMWLDKEYKQSIKERDGYKCQNPDCWGKCNHLPLTIHHIDYNKKNCQPSNLITLCVSCNFRANANRKYWQRFYQGILSKKLNVIILPRGEANGWKITENWRSEQKVNSAIG